jgi:hypothetical protein
MGGIVILPFCIDVRILAKESAKFPGFQIKVGFVVDLESFY